MFKQDNLLVDSEIKLQGRVTLHRGSAAPQQTLQHILIALFCLSKEKRKKVTKASEEGVWPRNEIDSKKGLLRFV